MLTDRTVPVWYWRDFLFFVCQSQVLVEDGLMTIDERTAKVEEKYFDLKPEGETWTRENDSMRTSTMKPTRFVISPEL
jgi:hypothetical protein